MRGADHWLCGRVAERSEPLLHRHTLTNVTQSGRQRDDIPDYRGMPDASGHVWPSSALGPKAHIYCPFADAAWPHLASYLAAASHERSRLRCDRVGRGQESRSSVKVFGQRQTGSSKDTDIRQPCRSRARVCSASTTAIETDNAEISTSLSTTTHHSRILRY